MSNGPRSPDEVARYLGTNPRALTKWLREQARVVRGVLTVDADGLHAECRAGRWRIELSRAWLDSAAGWVPIEVAAKIRGVTTETLRQGLGRRAKSTPVGADVTYAGVHARKLGDRWKCRREPDDAAGVREERVSTSNAAGGQ